MGEALREKIHEANVAVLRFEVEYYELLYLEVYSKQEQKRIDSLLKNVNKLMTDNQKKLFILGQILET